MKKSMIAMMAAAAMSAGVFAVQAGEQDTPTKLYNYLSSRKAGDKAALSCYTKATQKSMENFARAKEAAEKRDALTFMRYTTFAYKADAEDAQIQKVVDYYKSMNPEMLNQMMDAYLKTSPVTDMKSEVLEGQEQLDRKRQSPKRRRRNQTLQSQRQMVQRHDR